MSETTQPGPRTVGTFSVRGGWRVAGSTAGAGPTARGTEAAGSADLEAPGERGADAVCLRPPSNAGTWRRATPVRTRWRRCGNWPPGAHHLTAAVERLIQVQLVDRRINARVCALSPSGR